MNRTAEVFNHGPVLGISDSLDAIQEWVTSVRAPIVPEPAPAAEQAGRAVSSSQRGGCHGGAKWTKSRTSPVFANNPTFAEDPLGANFFVGVKPIDTERDGGWPADRSLVTRAGRERSLSSTRSAPSTPQIRWSCAVRPRCAGQSTRLCIVRRRWLQFTVAARCLSLSAPYFHDGSAQTLDDVMKRHLLANGQTVDQTVSPQELADLLAFVRGIDDQTAKVESDTDRFLR